MTTYDECVTTFNEKDVMKMRNSKSECLESRERNNHGSSRVDAKRLDEESFG
jgi:hypothetical protein